MEACDTGCEVRSERAREAAYDYVCAVRGAGESVQPVCAGGADSAARYCWILRVWGRRREAGTARVGMGARGVTRRASAHRLYTADAVHSGLL